MLSTTALYQLFVLHSEGIFNKFKNLFLSSFFLARIISRETVDLKCADNKKKSLQSQWALSFFKWNENFYIVDRFQE
jgi:hypothetical protein